MAGLESPLDLTGVAVERMPRKCTASTTHRSSAKLQPLNLGGDKALGIPIRFFFKKISKAQIARLWLDKHFAMAKALRHGQDQGRSGGGQDRVNEVNRRARPGGARP